MGAHDRTRRDPQTTFGSSRAHGHNPRRLRALRRALRAAATSTQLPVPTVQASAVEQAAHWHRRAWALDLIAANEADAGRAQTARADAEVARRIARGLGEPHAVLTVGSEPASAAGDVTGLDTAAELHDDLDDDALEVSWP